jgi:hypothetical protein
MTINRIRLDAQRHANFLAEERKDPITKELLRPGMEIIICAHDNIAFISENWSGECPFCHGTETLQTVPTSTELRIGRSVRRPSDIEVSGPTGSPHRNSTTSAFQSVIYLFIIAATICIIYFGSIFVMNIARGVGNWVSSTISEISTAISDLGKNTVEESSTPTLEPNSDNPQTTPTARPRPTLQPSDVTFLDPSVCSEIVRVEVKHTAKGDVLTIYCSNNVFYRLDPLAEGKHVIGPNGKFMVYATLYGDIYATRAGKRSWKPIGDFREFHMIKIQGVAELDVSIEGDYVVVYEKNMKERKKVLIPKEISK